MARGGPNCWGKGLQKGARGWGQEGCGKGGGERGPGGWWGRGVGRGFNRSFEQNRYRYIDFGYRNAHYETKSAEIAFFGGFPQFLAGNPRGMTSQSRKNVIISPKKSENEMCERFYLIIYARRSSHIN